MTAFKDVSVFNFKFIYFFLKKKTKKNICKQINKALLILKYSLFTPIKNTRNVSIFACVSVRGLLKPRVDIMSTIYKMYATVGLLMKVFKTSVKSKKKSLKFKKFFILIFLKKVQRLLFFFRNNNLNHFLLFCTHNVCVDSLNIFTATIARAYLDTDFSIIFFFFKNLKRVNFKKLKRIKKRTKKKNYAEFNAFYKNLS